MRTSTVSSALCRACSVSALALVAACSFSSGVPATGGQGSGSADGGVDASPADGSLVDAVTVDASPDGPPPWDPTMCPAEYTLTLTGTPQSRYRLIDTSANVNTQHVDCNDDHAGWTHLVSLDDATEATQIRASITSNTFYVGAVQPRDQADTGVGWLTFAGTALPSAAWQTGQPNDNAGVENNDQNFAAADDSTGLLNDVSGSGTYRAVCECDGQAIPAAVASAFAASAP